ncbi:MAG TPA: hypothetical protein VMN56_18530 [Casimicrobiaceae bacterium]|nr:hypothetical protein [Casimicrobiaceae bacterium]
MQAVNTLKLYEVGRRGRPVATIEPGDLADPAAKPRTLRQRIAKLWSDFVGIVEESRRLEASLRRKYPYLSE